MSRQSTTLATTTRSTQMLRLTTSAPGIRWLHHCAFRSDRQVRACCRFTTRKRESLFQRAQSVFSKYGETRTTGCQKSAYLTKSSTIVNLLPTFPLVSQVRASTLSTYAQHATVSPFGGAWGAAGKTISDRACRSKWCTVSRPGLPIRATSSFRMYTPWASLQKRHHADCNTRMSAWTQSCTELRETRSTVVAIEPCDWTFFGRMTAWIREALQCSTTWGRLPSIVCKASMFQRIVVSAGPLVNHVGIDVFAQAHDQAAQPRASLRAREAALCCGNHTSGQLRRTRHRIVRCHGGWSECRPSTTASWPRASPCAGASRRRRLSKQLGEQAFDKNSRSNVSATCLDFHRRRRVADSNNSTSTHHVGVVGTDTAHAHEASDVPSKFFPFELLKVELQRQAHDGSNQRLNVARSCSNQHVSS